MFQNIKNTVIPFMVTLLISAQVFAEGEAHEASGGGLPQFDPTSWPSQLFWLAIFFTLLYVVFGKAIIPTLGNTIENRASYIAEHIRKAEAITAEAEILKNEMNAALKKAANSAGTHIAEAEALGKSKLSSALTDFRTRYEQQVATTEQNIEKAKQSAMVDMEQIVVSLASQAAEKIAGIPASESGAESVVKSLGRKVA